MFIDTHSHLFLGKLADAIPEAIGHLQEANFSHSIQIGTSIDASRTCIELAKIYPIIRATIGIHPCEAQNISEEKISEYTMELEKMLLSEERKYIVGIGEIGFDEYHLSKDFIEAEHQKLRQKLWFAAQAELALKYDIPVVIHTRNCPDKTLEELKNSGLKKFVIHCFSEDWNFAQKIFIISEEAKISFTGILTYPQSIEVQEVAKKCPLEKIMIETDAPYLIPQQMKGIAKYCEPMFTRYVFETLCSFRTEEKEVIESTLWDNSVKFFGL
ncbi:MAG: TatD family hydrolase [Candidatus Gracilibacteria bacterium]